MNRRQRRAQERRHRKFDICDVADKADREGGPWHVFGFTGACRDCSATASMYGHGGSTRVISKIYHDEGCPALHGVVEWEALE